MSVKIIYKVNIIGDEGVGKTNYIKKLCNKNKEREQFDTDYSPTKETIIHELIYEGVYFTIYDSSGQEKYNLDPKFEYASSDGAIFMFDCNSENSLYNLTKWIRKYKKINPHSYVIICGNKSDIGNTKGYYEKLIQFSSDVPLESRFIISNKSMYNFDKPFCHLYDKMINSEF